MSTATRRARRVAFGLAATAGLLTAQSAAASAEDFVSIPISGVVTGPEGSELLVASEAVPAEFIGQTCEVVGQTVNQESVHDNNDLLIVTGGQTLTIPDYEDEGFITYEAGEIAEISSTIEVYVRFGPDEVSSGGFQLRVTCGGVDITPPPPAGPTTVPPAPTTTVPPEPTTTAPPTTAPTTAPTPAPTTAPTTPPPPAPPPAGPETGPQLPVTGSETVFIALVGIFLVAAGVASRDVAKSRLSGLFDN